jgi:CHAT domain-containing protein
MKPRPFLAIPRSPMAVCGLLLCACGSAPHRDEPAEQYRKARLQLNYGNSEEAAKLSKAAQADARSGRAGDWMIAFQVLDAELLGRAGRTAEAIAALNAIVPPTGRPDIRARRSAALANELCIYTERSGAAAGADRFRQAERLLDDVQQAAAGAGPEVQAEAELRRASCLIRERRFDPAEAVLRRLIDFTRAHDLPFLRASALVTMISVLWLEGHAEDGLAYGAEALGIGRQIGADSVVLKSLVNLSLCYTKIGDYDVALEYLKQAGSVTPQPFLRDDVRIVFTNTGNLLYNLRDYGGAAANYTRALEIARQEQNKGSIALLLTNLGETAVKQGDIASAAKFTAEALQRRRELKDEPSLRRAELLDAKVLFAQGNTEASRAEFQSAIGPASPEDVVWEAHAGLANIYLRMQRTAEAEREFRAAIAQVESSRAALKLDQSKITFQSSASELYSSYVDFLANNGRAREASMAADRSRATTLAQRMGAMLEPAGTGAPVPPARGRVVVLSYWLADGGSYLWVTTGTGVEQFRLPARNEIETAVEHYQRFIESPRDALRDAGEEGVRLWKMLVGPAAKLIPAGSQILLVADRGLHLLNFETLVAPDPIPHFWIEDVTIRQAPSLAGLSATTTAGGIDSILLMGAPAAASREFPPLANSAAEVSAIAGLFPAASRVLLTGTAATPAAYLQCTPQHFRYIHFAAHATANRVSPLDSAVIFARSGDDYRLYARDVAKVPLNAELVTVSACRSAGARAYAGEGLVGFTWAFLGAGARNVIAGLWKVEDASTAQVMLQLYRELRLGRTPPEALRNAKLGLLHSGTAYRRPFYWAPFLLYTRVR